ncbi:MAG: tryptophan synthase subunit alpha [Planctomycetaceae bacterium]|nr:tryptophan synthase subunit alpha [Planctomycetaceae bacterium]
MRSISAALSEFASQQQTAIMPFVTAGDPDLAFTEELLRRLDGLQPGLIEIGFPYSDPIADGPVIQASYTRALASQLRVDQIFESIGRVRPDLTQPLVAMVSYAIVLRYGSERFLEKARSAGFSGLIVPDFLWESEDPLRTLCLASGLDLIPLITPTTPPDRVSRIAQQASGFIYYVSVAGVTGERTGLPQDLQRNLAHLRRESPVPVCVGFGISQPGQVRELRSHCDGVIVGSAIVKRIAALSDGDASTRPNRKLVLDEIANFVADLIRAGNS